MVCLSQRCLTFREWSSTISQRIKITGAKGTCTIARLRVVKISAMNSHHRTCTSRLALATLLTNVWDTITMLQVLSKFNTYTYTSRLATLLINVVSQTAQASGMIDMCAHTHTHSLSLSLSLSLVYIYLCTYIYVYTRGGYSTDQHI